MEDFRGLVFFGTAASQTLEAQRGEKLQYRVCLAVSLASDVMSSLEKVILEKFKN